MSWVAWPDGAAHDPLPRTRSNVPTVASDPLRATSSQVIGPETAKPLTVTETHGGCPATASEPTTLAPSRRTETTGAGADRPSEALPPPRPPVRPKPIAAASNEAAMAAGAISAVRIRGRRDRVAARTRRSKPSGGSVPGMTSSIMPASRDRASISRRHAAQAIRWAATPSRSGGGSMSRANSAEAFRTSAQDMSALDLSRRCRFGLTK